MDQDTGRRGNSEFPYFSTFVFCLFVFLNSNYNRGRHAFAATRCSMTLMSVQPQFFIIPTRREADKGLFLVPMTFLMDLFPLVLQSSRLSRKLLKQYFVPDGELPSSCECDIMRSSDNLLFVMSHRAPQLGPLSEGPAKHHHFKRAVKTRNICRRLKTEG